MRGVHLSSENVAVKQPEMEPIIVIVGFLGAGKTTFLKKITQDLVAEGRDPFIILNDYENANLDSQQFLNFLGQNQIKPLSGSCICCSGITELRIMVNSIAQRSHGITLVEANGTTDACELLGFLAVGVNERYLPPVQISIVDARHWQKRGYHNGLEANQIQVSSLIVLNRIEDMDTSEIEAVKNKILQVNPSAEIILWNDFEICQLEGLERSVNQPEKLDHLQSHWSACSVDLPDPIQRQGILNILEELPSSILRVKGCTRIGDDTHYTYFERTPTGETFMRPYSGRLVSGPKLLVVGPGSEPHAMVKLVERHS